jgi:hypothetical protein
MISARMRANGRILCLGRAYVELGILLSTLLHGAGILLPLLTAPEVTPEAWRRVTRTGARVAANAALRATAFILSMCLGGYEGVWWRVREVVL